MNYRLLVDMAVLAGELMLISGAEVYRIEDTVVRILKHSGVEKTEVFVLATGIFATLSEPSGNVITVVKRVDRRATNLNRIYNVNEVSRRFCKDEATVEASYERLQQIAGEIQYNHIKKSVGYVMTSAFFAVLFGGGGIECIAAAAAGAILSLAVFGAGKLRLNDFCLNAAAAFSAALGTLLLQRFIFTQLSIDAVIISAMMPLVPGVTFTSAIRDTLNGDYSSGCARIMEAVVVALAVAFGVGFAMLFFSLPGGVL